MQSQAAPRVDSARGSLGNFGHLRTGDDLAAARERASR
jgi:hypothetical protein